MRARQRQVHRGESPLGENPGDVLNGPVQGYGNGTSPVREMAAKLRIEEREPRGGRLMNAPMKRRRPA